MLWPQAESYCSHYSGLCHVWTNELKTDYSLSCILNNTCASPSGMRTKFAWFDSSEDRAQSCGEARKNIWAKMKTKTGSWYVRKSRTHWGKGLKFVPEVGDNPDYPSQSHSPNFAIYQLLFCHCLSLTHQFLCHQFLTHSICLSHDPTLNNPPKPNYILPLLQPISVPSSAALFQAILPISPGSFPAYTSGTSPT